MKAVWALAIALRIVAFRRTPHRALAWYLALCIPCELALFAMNWFRWPSGHGYDHFWRSYECLSLLGLAAVTWEAVSSESRCGAAVAREAHNLQVAGSNPVAATKFLDIPLTKRWRSAECESFVVKGKVINRLWLRVRPGQSRFMLTGSCTPEESSRASGTTKPGTGVSKGISVPIVLTAIALLLLHHHSRWPAF